MDLHDSKRVFAFIAVPSSTEYLALNEAYFESHHKFCVVINSFEVDVRFDKSAELNCIRIPRAASSFLNIAYGDEVSVSFSSLPAVRSQNSLSILLVHAPSLIERARAFIIEWLLSKPALYFTSISIIDPKYFMIHSIEMIALPKQRSPFSINSSTKVVFMNSQPSSLDSLASMEKHFAPYPNFKTSSESLKIGHDDVKYSAKSKSEVDWADIGGNHDTKQKLIECLDFSSEKKEMYNRLGISRPKGVLLYGPPGCSKTLLAKAISKQFKRSFYSVKGPEIFTKWVGDSEKNLRDIFAVARKNSPSVVFFDEIDAIGSSRGDSNAGAVAERVLTQLLVEMDGIDSGLDVLVVAATNRPEILDKALLRPGRFDRHIFVGLPDANSRAEIFGILSRRMNFDCRVTAEYFTDITNGLSGAEIVSRCEKSALLELERASDRITLKSLDAVFR